MGRSTIKHHTVCDYNVFLTERTYYYYNFSAILWSQFPLQPQNYTLVEISASWEPISSKLSCGSPGWCQEITWNGENIVLRLNEIDDRGR